jgi:3-oxoacyl-[acyl-carrier protein] reductase
LIDGGLVPMRRWGEPDDIGNIAAGLAGGKFAFATGSVIQADGGLSIGRL